MSDLTERQQGQLVAYAAAVRASPHNLLSRRALEELEDRHIAESLLFAAGLRDGPCSLLDIGTGGGLPGLVVAIARPDIRVTLLDATEKKISFVAETAEAIGVPVRTLHGRAEELAGTFGGQFDLVSARAVAPLSRLIEWSVPFLAPGGVFHAIKGQKWPEELRDAAPQLRRLGAVVIATPTADVIRDVDARDPLVVSIGIPGS
jgi:16S rRNA (guanine527-N7)-methyltransferase